MNYFSAIANNHMSQKSLDLWSKLVVVNGFFREIVRRAPIIFSAGLRHWRIVRAAGEVT